MILNRLPMGNKIDISGATITKKTLTYSNTTYYPSDAINTVKVNGVTLTQGIDYTIEGSGYKDAASSASASPASRTGTIVGIGKYKGSKQFTWQINRATSSSSKSISVTGTMPNKVYKSESYAKKHLFDVTLSLASGLVFQDLVTSVKSGGTLTDFHTVQGTKVNYNNPAAFQLAIYSTNTTSKTLQYYLRATVQDKNYTYTAKTSSYSWSGTPADN